MNTLKQKTLFFLISSISSTNAWASTPTCAEKYKEYSTAQITWQVESSKIAADLLPEHSKLIYQYRDIQLGAIERRGLAVQIALQNFPDDISTLGGVNQWLNLTPALEEKLIQFSPEYAEISSKYNSLIAQPTADNGPEFQKTFQRTVLADAKFMQLMKDFSIKSRDLNSQRCLN